MKRHLIEMLERAVLDIRDAINALDHDDIQRALEALNALSARAAETVRSLLEDRGGDA